MYTRRYAFYGAVFGLGFPLVGTAIEAATRGHGLGLPGLLRAQAGSALLWIVDTAPLFLGVLAALAGRAHDRVLALDDVRRDRFDRTASDLVAAAQALSSTVASFSSTAAETAASVRETTATMALLGQTATKSALTAETVIGLARQGEKVSVEGLSAVEASLAEMRKLADEVRGLSTRIDALSGRLRGVFEVASVVSAIADRSQRLAQRAVPEEIGSELRSHSDETRRAAARVDGILAEVERAMAAALEAAEGGVRRAERGASVASSTGETIRRLATALRDSSQAAQEIATVAQQQDHGIDRVLAAMNEIYLATQETMSSTQAVANEARALNELASGLKRVVDS